MKMRELFSDESKWTKSTLARDPSGEPVHFNSENAICFCLSGAAMRCYPDDEYKSVVDMINDYVWNITKQEYYFVKWNDESERSFSDVKKLVDELDI